jgi:TolB-like protein/class 3 adenylate cyclase
MPEQRVERRLSTILAADVVGYSRMVGIDELGTISAVKAVISELVEPKSAQYSGRIVKLMGDGILMEFPSVVDAIQFAVEMQGAASTRNANIPEEQQIVFRVGINIGDIIVDGDDIHGNGVNIAARLEALAQPGGVYLSEAAFQQADGKLKLNFSSEGAHQVKNIAAPIVVYSVVQDELASALLTAIVPIRKPRPVWLIPSIFVLCVVLIGLVSWQWLVNPEELPKEISSTPLLPAKPSIAVLPFQVIGDQKDTQYFLDGLTNDLTTDLSRFHGLFVSASHSVFELKEQKLSVKEIGQRLGVRYVLQGSARGTDSRIRVNTELVEADTGEQLWAEKFDRELTDVFAVQDEIVQNILGVMTVKLDQKELDRSLAKHPTSLQAYDYVLRGRALLRAANRDDNHASQDMFQTAIEIEPTYGLAYSGLGSAVLQEATSGWSNNPTQGLNRAHDLAQAGNDIDPHPQARALLGSVYLLMRHFDLAREELDAAIAANPNDAESYATLAGVNLWSSRLEEALEGFQKSIRLNPEASEPVLTGLGITYFLRQEFAKAAVILRKAIAQYDENPLTHAVLAAANKQLGKEENIQFSVENVRKLHPFFSAESYRSAFPNAVHGDYLADGFISVGLK